MSLNMIEGFKWSKLEHFVLEDLEVSYDCHMVSFSSHNLELWPWYGMAMARTGKVLPWQM